MKIDSIWKWSGFVSIGIAIGFVISVRQTAIMSNPNPKFILAVLVALGLYSFAGGIVTAKRAQGLSANMLGMLNILTGLFWLVGAYGMATFPVQH